MSITASSFVHVTVGSHLIHMNEQTPGAWKLDSADQSLGTAGLCLMTKTAACQTVNCVGVGCCRQGDLSMWHSMNTTRVCLSLSFAATLTSAARVSEYLSRRQSWGTKLIPDRWMLLLVAFQRPPAGVWSMQNDMLGCSLWFCHHCYSLLKANYLPSSGHFFLCKIQRNNSWGHLHQRIPKKLK